jgi:hypothetical protein
MLETLLPASPANHESVRNRTHAVALRLEAADRQAAAAVVVEDTAAAEASRPIVMLDGAYVRAVPGHQLRNFEVICGKIEQEGRSSRRFALVRSVAEQPHALLRAALLDQGWREGLRWSPSAGQFGGLDKLDPGCRQAANRVISSAPYASFGVCPAKALCGRPAL